MIVEDVVDGVEIDDRLIQTNMLRIPFEDRGSLSIDKLRKESIQLNIRPNSRSDAAQVGNCQLRS